MAESGLQGMKDKDYYGLSIVLGSCEVTMLELVKMYAALANNGVQSDINFIPRVRKINSRRLLTKESAFIVRKMLEENVPPYQTKPLEITGVWEFLTVIFVPSGLGTQMEAEIMPLSGGKWRLHCYLILHIQFYLP